MSGSRWVFLKIYILNIYMRMWKVYPQLTAFNTDTWSFHTCDLKKKKFWQNLRWRSNCVSLEMSELPVELREGWGVAAWGGGGGVGRLKVKFLAGEILLSHFLKMLSEIPLGSPAELLLLLYFPPFFFCCSSSSSSFTGFGDWRRWHPHTPSGCTTSVFTFRSRRVRKKKGVW